MGIQLDPKKKENERERGREKHGYGGALEAHGGEWKRMKATFK